MISILSLVTSVKDYLEVAHKLIEFDSESFSNYTDLGPILTYVVISLKNFFVDFLSLSWLKNIWSLPIIIPDISSAMISEISVLDGYFHNAFNFLDTPALTTSPKTINLMGGLEKFTIGILNSCFLFLPTSIAHIITLRRFVMQGLEAGYISGLGTIAGNLFWLSSVILGWRFFVIPWLSLDIFRYVLGFILLVKYMWDSYNERKMVLEDLSKRKIFFLNFLLVLTEQTSIYPFISNFSFSPEVSMLETFPADSSSQFLFIHLSYLVGIGLGSFCLLQFTCWFWENPAFKIYMWIISSYKVPTSLYYKALNFIFLYLTMIAAIASIPYYGLDYTITNPLGFVNDDRLVQDKTVLETSFLGTKASDRNTRRNRGRHGRRERWKRRIRKYRTFDASLYDQGIYDLFTIEDLNYGFDRFWLRRKLRNHRVRFRFFPGPWMRSFKKQLAKPRLESYTGPRIEFFRILFEQVYHPAFHARSEIANNTSKSTFQKASFGSSSSADPFLSVIGKNPTFTPRFEETRGIIKPDIFSKRDPVFLRNTGGPVNGDSNSAVGDRASYAINNNLIYENSMLRKFVRKLDTRFKTAEIVNNLNSTPISDISLKQSNLYTNPRVSSKHGGSDKVYSKRWKELISKIYHEPKSQISSSNFLFKNVHRNFYNSSLKLPSKLNIKSLDPLDEKHSKNLIRVNTDPVKKQSSQMNTLSRKDFQILRYRTTLLSSRKTHSPNDYSSTANRVPVGQPGPTAAVQSSIAQSAIENSTQSSDKNFLSNQSHFMLAHPLKFYLQQEAAFQRKLRYYTPSIFRKFSIENNAPYFRVMMRRYFYNYKPTNRWERTMKVASLRKARRKTTRKPRKLRVPFTPRFFETRGENPRESLVPVSNSEINFNTLEKDNTRVSSKHDPVFLRNTGGPVNREQIGDNNLPSDQRTQESFPDVSNTNIPGDISIKRASPISAEQQLAFGGSSGIFKDLTQRIQKPTYNYSVVSKKASRYRYQIYKDVMQHWYYSPFNRLLLKFDVDSFIRRQPKQHFLTAKEENLLHLRRYLLSEHYNTLRWYTNMEHYRTMKTKIGSSKSFSSRAYNQQFTGTFKKIRHLFAITPTLNPSLSFTPRFEETRGLNEKTEKNRGKFLPNNSSQELNVLKFDQPLYNSYPNTSKNPLMNPLIIHEELLNDNSLVPQNTFTSQNMDKVEDGLAGSLNNNFLDSMKTGGTFDPRVSSKRGGKGDNEDLLSQSQNIVRQYLLESSEIRKNYIQQLFKDKDYTSLTNFLYSGQKLRGNSPITNQSSLINQEKEYLLTDSEKESIQRQYNSPETKRLLRQYLNEIISQQPESRDSRSQESLRGESSSGKTTLDNFYINFLKNWKRRVNNQESLKNYLSKRVDKREKRKINKEKNLQKKIKTLNDSIRAIEDSASFSEKATLRDLRSTEKSSSLPFTPRFEETRGVLASQFESVPTGLQKAVLDGLKTTQNNFDDTNSRIFLQGRTSSSDQVETNRAIENHAGYKRNTASSDSSLIKNVDTLRNYQKLKLNKEIRVSSTKLHEISKQLKNKSLSTKMLTNIKTKFSYVSNLFQKTYKGLNALTLSKVTYLLKPVKQKTMKNWRKKQRAIAKQKRLRKEFKLLITKKQGGGSAATQQTAFNLPNRKKRIDSDVQALNDASSSLNVRDSEVRDFPERKNLNLDNLLANDTSERMSFLHNNFLTNFFNFKRERSPQRRYRVRRNRGIFRKRNLADLMKKDIKTFSYKSNFSNSRNSRDLRSRELVSPKEEDLIERNRFYLKMRSIFGGTSSISKSDDGKYYNKPVVDNELPVFRRNTGGPDSNPKTPRFEETRGLLFEQARVKQRKNKQRKLRAWKQKRMALRSSQKRRKYLKRRRYSISKIRVLSKQFQRVKNKLEVQNWWWKQYLPSIQASTDALWQIEKDRLIQQKLSQLSPLERIERDKQRFNNKLQIGKKDFKPLALPETLQISSNLNPFASSPPRFEETRGSSRDLGSVTTNSNTLNSSSRESRDILSRDSNRPFENTHPENQGGFAEEMSSYNLVDKLSQNILLQENQSLNPNARRAIGALIPAPERGAGGPDSSNSFINSSFDLNPTSKNFSLLPNTSLPFYAGWDESLRKFVVTNRLLSRQDAGYEIDKSFVAPNLLTKEATARSSSSLTKERFTDAPLQGMNAATTLYWQVPFTTYDPDQFFALGMDGFSPISWRKMIFRHSILKSWLGNRNVRKTNLSENETPRDRRSRGLNESSLDEKTFGSRVLSHTTQTTNTTIGVKNVSKHEDLLGKMSKLRKYSNQNSDSFDAALPLNVGKNSQDGFNNSRRLKKRLIRVKKHPRTPVWFPSGPLINQVLPVHYIYVFYKRSRLPRNRYLSRRLLNVNAINNSETLNMMKSSDLSLYNYDFTLRKRLKPKRKYHLKHDSSIVIPRRLKLLNLRSPFTISNQVDLMNSNTLSTQSRVDSILRWRPLSSKKLNKSFSELMNEQKTLRARRQQRLANPGQMDQPSLRVKQLKRRVQRQIIRSVWRYRPRAGGFVWPGDYLKLELTRMPRLKSPNKDNQNYRANRAIEDRAGYAPGADSPDSSLIKRKSKRTKKRTLVEWQVQPKNYLLEKHNIKVLKKRLETSQRSGSLPLKKKLKELNFKINN